MLPGKKTYRHHRYKGAVVCHANGAITIILPNGKQTNRPPTRFTHLNPLFKKAQHHLDTTKQTGLY